MQAATTAPRSASAAGHALWVVLMRLAKVLAIVLQRVGLRLLEGRQHCTWQPRDAQAQVVDHRVDQRHVRRLHLGDDLLQRQVVQVTAETELNHEHAVLVARHRGDLESRQRRKEDLLLSRKLRETTHVSTAIDHPHANLKEDFLHLVALLHVADRHLPLRAGAHERAVHAAHHAHLLLPELVGQQTIHAAIDGGRLGELRQLDDARIDGVDRRRVAVRRVLRAAEPDHVFLELRRVGAQAS
eukprot:7391445-Prymnesium_polylepis.1